MLPAAIRWLIDHAQATETLADGTVEHRFQGRVPWRMKQAIREAATLRRDNGSSVTYNASGDTWGWSATFGAYHSTANTLKFSYADYTVPASKT